MANLPEPQKLAQDILSPVGKILLDIRKVRENARKDLNKLPATDPMAQMLNKIDHLLETAEDQIIIESKRPPGMSSLDYIKKQMGELQDEILRAQATPGEIVRKVLPPGRRHLPPGR